MADGGIRLGKTLLELRKKKGLDQRDIADIVGVERSTYGKWETGDSHPPLTKLVDLADLFEVSTDYLLGRDERIVPTVRIALEAAQEYIENTKIQTLALIERTLKSLPDDEEQMHTADWIAPKVQCAKCGGMATVNIYADQGEIADYFYECECGNIIETEGENA